MTSNYIFEAKVRALQVAPWATKMKFPEIACSRTYRPKLDLLYPAGNVKPITSGLIDWSTSFWLAQWPESLDVAVAGGFILSSLQGNLTVKQDIDLYVLNPNQLTDVLSYFLKLRPDITVTASVVDDWIQEKVVNLLTLTCADERPLQIISAGQPCMHEIVRTFDLTHLRLWVDKTGLWVDVEAAYELIVGFSRATGPRCWSKERLIKYAARGWDIYGKSNLIVKTQNDELKDHITVDMTTLAINELAQMYQPFYYDYHGYSRYYAGHINHLKWVDILSFIQNIKPVLTVCSFSC